MSLANKLQEPPRFDLVFSKEEVRTYHPQTKSFGYNDTVEFIINQSDVLIDFSASSLMIEGEFRPDAAGAGTCKMTTNAGAFLFSDITYELNNQVVEKVREVGYVSMIRAMLCYNQNESEALRIAGWTLEKPLFINENKKFVMHIPLAFLFNLFNDYKLPIIGKHVFRFTRAVNDSNCYMCEPAEGVATKKASLELDNVYLKIKQVHLNMTEKLAIMERIDKQEQFYLKFRKWDFYENPSLPNTSDESWPIRTSSEIERPRFVIATFQTNLKSNFKENVSLFHHLNVTDMKLLLNSEKYPFEPMRLNFNELKYTGLYQAYLDFQKTYLFKINSEPLLDFEEFKKRPLFVFDCSKHADSLKPTSVDVKLEITSATNFPAGTRAFCILVHDCVYTYTPLTMSVQNMTE